VRHEKKRGEGNKKDLRKGTKRQKKGMSQGDTLALLGVLLYMGVREI